MYANTEKVSVSEAVYEGIEAVRDSGETNMLDRQQVMLLASGLGYLDAALWVYYHPRDYWQGVMGGFEVE